MFGEVPSCGLSVWLGFHCDGLRSSWIYYIETRALQVSYTKCAVVSCCCCNDMHPNWCVKKQKFDLSQFWSQSEIKCWQHCLWRLWKASGGLSTVFHSLSFSCIPLISLFSHWPTFPLYLCVLCSFHETWKIYTEIDSLDLHVLNLTDAAEALFLNRPFWRLWIAIFA